MSVYRMNVKVVYANVLILQARGGASGRVPVSTKTDPLASWHAKTKTNMP